MNKKALQKVAKELNKICELENDDIIDPKQDEKKLKKELIEVVSGDEPELDLYPEDGFSDDVWQTLAELGNESAKKVVSQSDDEEEEESEEEQDDESDDEEEDSDEEEDEDSDEDDDESEEEVPDREEILAMSRSDIKELIEEHELETDPNKYKGKKNLDALREAVADELGGEVEEETEEEETEEEETDLVKAVQNTSKLNELKAMCESYNEFKKLRKKAKDFKGLQGTKKLKAEMLKALGVEEEQEKPAKKDKADKKESKKTSKSTAKKEKTGPKMKRVDTVNQAIAELCKGKKGASYEEIYKRADEIYEESGGKAGSIATNITKNTIQTLVYFEVLEQKGDKLKMA